MLYEYFKFEIIIQKYFKMWPYRSHKHINELKSVFLSLISLSDKSVESTINAYKIK